MNQVDVNIKPVFSNHQQVGSFLHGEDCQIGCLITSFLFSTNNAINYHERLALILRPRIKL